MRESAIRDRASHTGDRGARQGCPSRVSARAVVLLLLAIVAAGPAAAQSNTQPGVASPQYLTKSSLNGAQITLPTAALVLTPPSISEAGGISTVTATLSAKSSEAVTLTVATRPGTTRTVAADFTQTGTTLTIAAGTTTSAGTVTVTAVDNNAASYVWWGGWVPPPHQAGDGDGDGGGRPRGGPGERDPDPP